VFVVGGDAAHVQTNYFGKGNTATYDRGGTSPVTDAVSTFNTYTIDWTPARIQWEINGAVVRVLERSAAEGNGQYYPQTPMRVKLGSWVGGSKANAPGTIAWAGGLTPFPGTYTYYVQSITVTDGVTTGDNSHYSYGDNTGSYQSILLDGNKIPNVDSLGSNNAQAAKSSNAVSSAAVVSSSVSNSASATTVLASATASVLASFAASSTTLRTSTREATNAVGAGLIAVQSGSAQSSGSPSVVSTAAVAGSASSGLSPTASAVFNGGLTNSAMTFGKSHIRGHVLAAVGVSLGLLGWL
jgi:beta-glucanase (GH16 family)